MDAGIPKFEISGQWLPIIKLFETQDFETNAVFIHSAFNVNRKCPGNTDF